MQSNQTAINEAGDKLAKILSYLAVDPSNRDLLANAIDLHLLVGQSEAAASCAQTAVNLYPDDPFFQHRYGNVLIAQGKPAEAEVIYIKLNSEVRDVNVAYNLAFVYFRQAKYAEAVATLSSFIQSPEISAIAVTLYLRALHHIGEVKQALEIVQLKLDTLPFDSEFLAVASLLYLDDGQAEEAQRLSTAAMAEGAQPIEALVSGGTVSLGHGDTDAADALFKKALEINPVDGRTWSGLGLTSLLKQDLGGASEQLERATTYMPQHIGTWHTLAWCKIMSQDISGAEEIFAKALAMDRNFGESHGGMAVVAALQGKKAVAEQYIEVALRLDPRGLSARYAQMILAGDVKDPVRFRQLATKIMSSRGGPFAETFASMLTKWTK